MGPLAIAMGLAQFVPQLTGWLTGSDKAEAVAEKAVAIAQAVTGASSGQDALAALQSDPAKALEYARAVLDQAVEFERLAAANAADINATMRAEAAAEHWPSYSWRPAIGFAVAVDLILAAVIVGLAYLGVMFGGVKPDVLTYLPGALAALTGLVAVASPILGIASWYRGKMQADPGIPTVNRG